MTIGIDISQLTYKHTGVANYLTYLLLELLSQDNSDQFVLFYSSLRGQIDTQLLTKLQRPNVRLVKAKLPPTFLDVLWNRLHIFPVENFIGDVDIFVTSDWVEPPTKKAKKVTILYDLIVYKYPQESTKKIVQTQRRKLAWVKKESSKILCISESTKKDAESILAIPEGMLEVIYPGMLL